MYSNGYIMLDFSMIDFSKHNQIIDGIYQRVFEVVGVNKFVIILGADGKTPLPACVSFTNGSYVIESFLYNFAITIDDNVRIENVSSDIIKDGIISAGSTWSSSKIKNEIDNIGGTEIIYSYDGEYVNDMNKNLVLDDDIHKYNFVVLECSIGSITDKVLVLFPIMKTLINNYYCMSCFGSSYFRVAINIPDINVLKVTAFTFSNTVNIRNVYVM